MRALSSRRAARHAAKGGCASSRASSSGSLARAKRLEKPRLISVRKRWAQFEEGATPICGSDTPVRRVVSRVSDASDTRVEESLRQAPTPPNFIFFRLVDVSLRLLRLRSRKIAAATFDSSDRERVTGASSCCGRHPTGALMRLSDAICEELAHTHHEKLIALKERSWLNPNLSHTAVRPGSATAWPMLGLRPCP